MLLLREKVFINASKLNISRFLQNLYFMINFNWTWNWYYIFVFNLVCLCIKHHLCYTFFGFRFATIWLSRYFWFGSGLSGSYAIFDSPSVKIISHINYNFNNILHRADYSTAGNNIFIFINLFWQHLFWTKKCSLFYASLYNQIWRMVFAKIYTTENETWFNFCGRCSGRLF